MNIFVSIWLEHQWFCAFISITSRNNPSLLCFFSLCSIHTNHQTCELLELINHNRISKFDDWVCAQCCSDDRRYRQRRQCRQESYLKSSIIRFGREIQRIRCILIIWFMKFHIQSLFQRQIFISETFTFRQHCCNASTL